jgi:hypothetical protein
VALALPSNPGSASLWRPLRSSTFRNLLIADVVSDVGTIMQSVGAAWLMVSLNGGPMYVALTQTASALPFFILALPAGAIGDIVDRQGDPVYGNMDGRRRGCACRNDHRGHNVSAATAHSDLCSVGWRRIRNTYLARRLARAGSKGGLPAASALNGIEFNFARAVGPALAGFVIASAGIGAAFLLNTLSFFGIILVVARWKRPAVKRATPPETVTGATVAAIRYVRYSPAVRIVLLRAGTAMFLRKAAKLPRRVARHRTKTRRYAFTTRR